MTADRLTWPQYSHLRCLSASHLLGHERQICVEVGYSVQASTLRAGFAPRVFGPITACPVTGMILYTVR